MAGDGVAGRGRRGQEATRAAPGAPPQTAGASSASAPAV